MKRLYLFQPQYANLGTGGIKQYWIPYSVGCLWSYVCSFEDISSNWTLSGLFYQRQPIEKVIDRMQEPDVCAFSCYVWNEQYDLTLAKAIKTRWPKCQIIFGGPQTGSNHLKYDFIDCIIFSEGEQAFLEVLRRCQNNEALELLMRRPRMENLDIPSPYLQGVFDGLMRDLPDDVKFQTILETNRGCPYACSYCDWGGLTQSKIKKFQLERIAAELEWVSRNPVTTMFLADANFGIFQERDLEIARIMKKILANSSVDYVALNFAKNSNRMVFEIARELKPFVKAVTLSMQSMNMDTLKAVHRDNLKSNNLIELIKLSKEYDVVTYTDMILGLPEESLTTWKQGLMKLIELGNDDYIDTNYANVLQNTELNLEQLQKHRCRTVQVANYMDAVDDKSDITEYTTIICETETMPLDDMAMSWMWHWLVQQYHTSGYSIWLCRYLYHVQNVPYQDYYDTLMDLTQNDNGEIGAEYDRIYQATQNLLRKGNLQNVYNTTYDYSISSYAIFYANRKRVFDLVAQAFDMNSGSDRNMIDLQRKAIYVEDQDLRQPIRLDVDIHNWQLTQTTYAVVPNPNLNRRLWSGTVGDFRVTKRGGYWKNTFHKIE